jgi:hypothetical protein
MDVRFGATNITTAVLSGVTVWVLIARLRGAVETNWPLFYYLGVVAFSTAIPGVLDPAWVYSGVVCALLLRFEFLGGFLLKVVRGIEMVVLLYLLYASVTAIII